MTIAAKLEDIFRALAPSDLAGAVDFRTGARASSPAAALLLEAFLMTPPTGVMSTPALKDAVDSVSAKASAAQRAELAELLKLYTSAGYPAHATRSHKLATDASGRHVEASSAQAVPASGDRRALIALVDAPYVHPTVRYADRAHMFLTAVPTHVMSKCVPRLDVEFKLDRPKFESGAQAPSLLRFLLGAAPVAGADASMLSANRVIAGDRELITSGMELFTAPQTLGSLSDAPGARYVPVIDSLRPLASLVGAEITVTPTVGMFSYKRAKLSFVLHDRSRMTDLSDFLKPEVYPKTTVVMTYGWSHPEDPSDPYAEFINSQSVVRESYGIVNASYSFESGGGVRVDLELFTRGVSELRSTKIAESDSSSAAMQRKMAQLRDDIASYRRAKRLDAETGTSAEVRPTQFLDGAERGSVLDYSSDELRSGVERLLKMLSQQDPRVDSALQKRLVASLKALPDDAVTLRKTISSEIADKFSAAKSGLDPFLPDPEKYPDHPVSGFVSARNATPVGVVTRVDRKISSFARVFTSFVMPAMLSADPKLDLQVIFYSMNSQAGPVASTNIGEFPVEMSVFVDRWREHAERRGTENVSVEEFVSVLADATVSDPRSVGYGLRSYYTYDSKGGFMEDPAQASKRESRDAELLGKHGVFKKPVIEMYVESSPARDGSRVTRIHVYDKQAHPYRAQGAFLRASDGSSTFYDVPKSRLKRSAEAADARNVSLIKQLARDVVDDSSGVRRVDASTNASLKAAIAATMPTLVYGTSCSSILSANLSSQHEALLSTVQMLRAGKKNNTQPSGAGTGGLPLRVIPSTLQLTMLGCALIQLAQMWFVDFMTGTTADNVYIVTQLTHSIAPGKFETQATLGFADAYGALEGAVSVESAIKSMSDSAPKAEESPIEKRRAIRRAPAL